MKIKTLVLNSKSAACLEALKATISGDCTIAVSPGSDICAIFDRMIEKQIGKKMDASAEMKEAQAWFASVGGDTAEIQEGIEKLRRYLVESMPFRFSGNSLQDYIFAELSVLCAKLVAAKIDAAGCIDGRNLMICDDSKSFIIDWKAAIAAVGATSFSGLHVISGGYGRTLSGYSVSLGKGGAELTATTIASVLHPELLEFLTDMDGIQSIPALEYSEAALLLSGEDSPIFPPALWPAAKEDVPIRICNLYDLEAKGSMITRQGSGAAAGITGLTCDRNLTLITVYGSGLLGSVGLSSTLFNALAARGVNVRFISQASAEYSISFAVSASDSQNALDAISSLVSVKQMRSVNDILYVEKEVSVVSVCGCRMRSVPGISGRVFTALGEAGVSIVAASQGGEELSISIVVDSKDAEAAVAALRPLVG